MTKIFLPLLFTICVNYSFAQDNTLLNFAKKSAATDKTGMTVLGSWAAANIAVSAFALNTNNKTTHYYHQMNIMWNGFNLALAGLGYIGAKKTKFTNISLANVLQHQNKTEKTFLFNAGLDVAYVAGGAYLTQRGKTKTDPSKLTGYGNAIMVNGGFLLLFDAVMYALHNKQGKQLNSLINKLQVNGTGGCVSMVYTF
jgi:hypothetical protein